MQGHELRRCRGTGVRAACQHFFSSGFPFRTTQRFCHRDYLTYVPVEIGGVECNTIDGEKLRIESLLRDGVEPRITGIQIHDVTLSDTRSALIVRIPRSWAAPHMVKFRGASKFYSRNADVTEIRNAFLLSETLADKMKDFRTKRLGKAIANELPMKMPDGPKAIMHLIPFSAFNPSEKHQLANCAVLLLLICKSSKSWN